MSAPVERLPPERLPADLVALRRFAVLMDEQFQIPGTRIRFGLDPLLGLFPGLGDVAGAMLSLWVVAGAYRHRVPGTTLARILWNVAADLLVGLVPVLGDFLDVLYKENVQNVELVIRHRDRALPPRSGGRLAAVVGGLAVVLLTFSALVFGILYAVLRQAAP